MNTARFVVMIMVIAAAPAAAQHDHDAGHFAYKDWRNQQDKDCCDQRHCKGIAEGDERRTGTAIEVRVEGKWCPVKPHMTLKTGHSPDWSVSHGCVLPGDTDPCERFICYTGKPEF